jgi:hypothetical protein
VNHHHTITEPVERGVAAAVFCCLHVNIDGHSVPGTEEKGRNGKDACAGPEVKNGKVLLENEVLQCFETADRGFVKSGSESLSPGQMDSNTAIWFLGGSRRGCPLWNNQKAAADLDRSAGRECGMRTGF